MDQKTISQLPIYTGDPSGFDVPGDTSSGTKKANLGSLIQKGIDADTTKAPAQSVQELTQRVATVEGDINKAGNLVEQVINNTEKLSELEKKTESISMDDVATESEAIVFTRDDGIIVGSIDDNGADFVVLKCDGKQVLTEHQDISGLATKKDVEKKQDKIDQISSIETTSNVQELILGNDDGSEEYVKVGSYGIKSKAYLDMFGNPIGPNIIIDTEKNELVFDNHRYKLIPIE